MFQRMKGTVTVNVPEVDFTTVTDIQVELVQEDTKVEMLFTGGNVNVANENTVMVVIPKDVAMQLEVAPLRGQIMFTYPNGFPDATKAFTVPVSELIKESGYGN